MSARVYMLLLFICAFFFQPASALEPVFPLNTENRVVAKISGNPVTESQILTIMKFSVFQKKDDDLPSGYYQRLNQGLFNEAIDNLTTRTILLKMAQEQKISISNAALKDVMESPPKGYKSHIEYLRHLRAFGIEEHELIRHTEEALKVLRVIENAVKDTPEATNEEIEKFYAGRKSTILAAEQVRASHIMLGVDPKASKRQKKAIKDSLEKIRVAIDSGKITFAEAARKYSQDKATAANGGDLGIILKGQREKAIETALFNTPQGGLTPVIELKKGYFLLRVDELKPKRQTSLEETKSLAAKYYNQRLKQKAASQFLAKIKESARIEMLMSREMFIERNSRAWENIFNK